MIFKIVRSSDDVNKPCENAYLKEKFRNKSGGMSYIWEIEIDSLNELMDLIKETNEPLIVFGPSKDDLSTSIEIYDEYRE